MVVVALVEASHMFSEYICAHSISVTVFANHVAAIAATWFELVTILLWHGQYPPLVSVKYSFTAISALANSRDKSMPWHLMISSFASSLPVPTLHIWMYQLRVGQFKVHWCAAYHIIKPL